MKPVCKTCADEFDREAVSFDEPTHCFICQRFIPGDPLREVKKAIRALDESLPEWQEEPWAWRVEVPL